MENVGLLRMIVGNQSTKNGDVSNFFMKTMGVDHIMSMLRICFWKNNDVLCLQKESRKKGNGNVELRKRRMNALHVGTVRFHVAHVDSDKTAKTAISNQSDIASSAEPWNSRVWSVPYLLSSLSWT